MSSKPRQGAENDGDSALSTVGALMEERLRYEAWLQALNARRAETPKHVFTRVHADYTSRLESVLSRLNGQVEALRTELTTLATRIATLEEQQHRARDERAEAELRAHVGELTPDAWREFLASSDATIARLTEQHAHAVETLRRTREFLDDAEKPATPAVPVPAVAAAPAPVPAAAPPGPRPVPRPSASVPQQEPARKLRPLPGRDTANGGVPTQPAPAAAARPQKFDELAFLSSVVEESLPADAPVFAAKVPQPASAPPPAPRPAAPAPRAAAPAPRPSVPAARPSAPPPRQSGALNPFAQRAAEKALNADATGAPKIDASKAHAGLAANVTANNPVVLRDKSMESAKTLKCAECGAANYPTEWYCERCGAELANL